MLVLSLCLTLTFAQRGSGQTTAVNRSLGYTSTYITYPGIASDTLGTADSTWSYTIGKLADSKHHANYYFDLDSTGGTAANVSIYIQKKAHDLADWVNTDTIVWAASVDSAFTYETSSSHSAAFWRTYFIMANDEFKMKVNRLDAYFVKP